MIKESGIVERLLDRSDHYLPDWADSVMRETATLIAELQAERDELRAAIFGNASYDPILSNGNFVEMAKATELGRLGALARALAAESSLDRVRRETIEECAKVAELTRVSANGHPQIDAPTPHDMKVAIATAIRSLNITGLDTGAVKTGAVG